MVDFPWWFFWIVPFLLGMGVGWKMGLNHKSKSGPESRRKENI